MKQVSAMNKWCTRPWIYFGLCITFLMTAIILFYWQEWSVELKIIAAVSALIPIHVVEEWVFPGGFHYQYNSFWHSDQLDRYPMCRLSDMYTNLIATFMYAGFTLYSVAEGEVPTGFIIGTIGFCALEVIIHSMFGIQMYQRFHSKGKQTIYGPGSITAYLGFGVFGVILCYQMMGRTITRTDWIVGTLVVIVGVGIICVLGPETIIKKRDNDYAFPSAGYFERFLN